MTTWRENLLDTVEAAVRARFGSAIIARRDVDEEGALRLAVTWKDGGGSYVRLAPDTPHTAISADEAVEVITDSLWRYAPIAGSA